MSQSGNSVGKKIYELRTYSIKPTCTGKYKQLTTEKYHLRTAHSKMIGFWMTEIGGVNEAVHLWEYDDLAHRASVRSAMSKDSKWISEYASIAHQYFDKQHNELLTVPWGEIATSPSQEGGVYELRALHVGSGRSTSLLQNIKDLTSLQEEILQEKQGKLISVFSTEIGNCNIG
ncbi:Protein NipSnap-like 3B [Holothuria leucospilota]|uniref:Protein NipSnap-like 3B n=1 Tax=Holothuria leucospilota TaxID=206669 RepID=A0A9Q1HDM6_HOLLE|nr:Protein NipSnap-like 3B [Holothuria leucospilota]